MKRRRFVQLMAGAAGYAAQRASGAPPLLASDQPGATHPLLGMYIHEGWPYKHPYAARTWTVEDWRGYADGMEDGIQYAGHLADPGDDAGAVDPQRPCPTREYGEGDRCLAQ